MPLTDFDDLLDTKATVTTDSKSVPFQVIGTPIGSDDIRGRMTDYSYQQLSNGDDDSVVRAGERARIHLGTVFGRLGKTLDLDDLVQREIASLWTIYELHLSLGHEEQGREWRIKAKDLIIALFGDYPEAAKPAEGQAAVGALAVPSTRLIQGRRRL